MRTSLATAGHYALAVVAAMTVSVVSLIAIAQVQWPAYPSSHQLHALTTVGQVGCLIALFCVGLLWRSGYQWMARVGAAIVLSAFVVVTLGMPLGATKLYLFGISVDQQFRTEYLARFADSPALHDMTYQGLPPFYPAGWFWLGGRAAALSDIAAWEMFKPWAITSIAIAVALAMVLWSKLIRFEYALIVTTATAAITLAYSSTEPYAAVITVLIVPVLVLAWSGLDAQVRRGSWAAVVGTGIFLGITATFYTLLLAYGAITVTVMALTRAWGQRSIAPLLRLGVIAVITATIGALTWLPFLLRATGQPLSDTGSALHYLPEAGAVLSFPMLEFSLLGGLCMVGTLWLIGRARTSTRAAALGMAVISLYGWSLLSMLTTLAGTTLLSFRLQPILTVLLCAAGVFGFIEISQTVAAYTSATVIPIAAVIGLIGAISFSQSIPEVLRPDLVIAYTDTDGNGQRGDRRAPGSEKFYPAIDNTIQHITGRPRAETVIMTTDYSFLSFYPYYGFQGLTPHYANPLAQFDARADAIESWAKIADSATFVQALDELPWQPPTVFLMRRGDATTSITSADTYTLRLASDVYPNHPNVRRHTVELDAALFTAPYFTVIPVGPFVVAIRNQQ